MRLNCAACGIEEDMRLKPRFFANPKRMTPQGEDVTQPRFLFHIGAYCEGCNKFVQWVNQSDDTIKELNRNYGTDA